MSTPPTHVQRLRDEGVLPPWAVLNAEQENAINTLSQAEVDTVISVHQKVGQIETPGPTWIVKIF
jgi:hypothetical protein